MQRGATIQVSSPAPAALLPTLAILGAVLLWGGSFSAMRVAVQALSPRAVMWVRMAVALAVLLPVLPRLWPGKRSMLRDWKPLMLMVAFQPCLYFWLESNALTLTTSSQAGVIASSVPLLVAVGARWFLGERTGAGALIGLVVSMAGVAWLTFSGDDRGQASNALLGNAMELGAMASAAAYMLLVKRLCGRYGPWTLTAMQVAAGALFFLPGGMTLWRAGATPWTPSLAMILAFLGAFVTLGAFGLYNWGMSRIPAGRASAFINLVPVVAVILGWALLGEALTPTQLCAAAVVFVGVWLSQRNGRASRD